MSAIAWLWKRAPENYLGIPTSLKHSSTNILQICWPGFEPSQEIVYIKVGFSYEVSSLLRLSKKIRNSLVSFPLKGEKGRIKKKIINLTQEWKLILFYFNCYH